MINTDQPNNESEQLTTADDSMVETVKHGMTPAQHKTTNRGHSAVLVVAIIALLLGVIAVSASGFLWYSLAVKNRLEIEGTIARAELIAEEFSLLRATQQSLIAEQTTLLRKIDENQKVFEEKLYKLNQETRNSLSEQKKQKNNLENQLKAEVDVLARSMEATHKQLDRGTSEWLLEEIVQLINLANERLLLVGDLPLAIRALEIAEKRIADLSDPSLLAIRRQLVSDIGMLSNISIPDVNGVVLNLSMLIQSVSTLPLAGEESLNVLSRASVKDDRIEDDRGDGNGIDNTISGASAKLIKDLSALIRIRNVDRTQAPSLAPELRFHVYESVRAPLNVAQLALLRRLPEAYHTSLDHAKVALMAGFDNDAQEVLELKFAIERLESIGVRRNYPDISNTLEMLRDIVSRRGGGD